MALTSVQGHASTSRRISRAPWSTSAGADGQRRRQPEHVRARGGDQEAGVQALGDELGRGPLGLEPDEEPGAAHGQRCGDLVVPLADVGEQPSSTVSTTAHAAAQTTGLPPKVEAWSPGTSPPARRRRRAERRSAGRSRAPSRARPRPAGRRAARRRRTCPCGRRRSAPRRDEQRAVLVGERRRAAARNSGDAG